MEWIESLKLTIDYVEDHLLEDINIDDIAGKVYMSPYYLMKGFSIVCGYTISEYIRYRRLYLAALDIVNKDMKVIDVAYEYGYDTPESFTKAFSRFHGVPPMQMKNSLFKIKPFLPLTIEISVKGGDDMNYMIEKKESISLIGYQKRFCMESAMKEIPDYWCEVKKNYETGKNSNDIQNMINECGIGSYAVCIGDAKGENLIYMIAGKYDGRKIPEGFFTYEIPAIEWACFKCKGPLPEALQTVNNKVFREWLPGNPEFEIAANLNIEWYSDGDTDSQDYKSEIWVPVRHVKPYN